MRETTQHFDPRQHMTSSTFEIFHYQDPRPAGVEVHHHDFYEVYFFLGGKMDYRVEGRIYHLEPGDLLLISPMEFHQPITESGEAVLERIVLWIDRGYLEQLSTAEVSLTRCFDTSRPNHTNLLRLSPAQKAEVTQRLGELIRERYSKEYGGELCASGILLRFMVELNRIAFGSAAQNPMQESSLLISSVLSYINDHYNEPLALDDLASLNYVSKYHLSHEFSRIVGTSVYRYIMLKRLLNAKQMISNGVSPTIACANCGFGDYTNFYRAFKAQYGISPSECISE